MNLSTMNLKEEFKLYNSIAPKKTMHMENGEFVYRYYHNPNPECDVTIITLAGGSGMADALFLMSRELSKKYHFATFNYPKDFSDNDSLSDAIACLIKNENMKNVYLLGQSYGGLIAQVTAKRHPEFIKGLILSSTCSLSNDLSFTGVSRMYHMISEEKEKKNKRLDRLLPSWALILFIKLAFKKRIPDEAVRNTVGEILTILKADLTSQYMMHMDGLLGDLRNHYGTHTASDFIKFDGEVLIIEPEDDDIFTPDMKQALFRIMTNPEIITDFTGGHLALMTDPNKYLEIVNDFLRKRNS